ncbi:MAG: hypothetical protein QM811_19170 [Pirellulales bacterium]
MIDRIALSIGKEANRKEFTEKLKSGDPYARLLAFRGLYANFTAMQAQQDLSDPAKVTLGQWQDIFRQYVDRETNPIVKSEALQMLMQFQKDANQNTVILHNLLADKDWQVRLTGILVSTSVPHDVRKDFLAPLKDDADEVISRLSQAVAEMPDPTPATQPSTTEPAAGDASTTKP